MGKFNKEWLTEKAVRASRSKLLPINLFSWILLGVLFIAARANSSIPTGYEKDLARYQSTFFGDHRPASTDSRRAILDRMMATILDHEIPFYVRVKYCVLFARICRKDAEIRDLCEVLSAQLKESEETYAQNTTLSNYIKNIGLTGTPEPTSPGTVATENEPRTEPAPQVVRTEPRKPHMEPHEAPSLWTENSTYLAWMLAAAISYLLANQVVHSRRKVKQPRKMTRAAKRAMVVDDDPISLMFAQRVLGSMGYQVEAFQNPLTALEHSRLRPYDLMVLDYQMPEMNGDDLAEAIDNNINQAWHPNLLFFTGKTKAVNPKAEPARAVRYCGTLDKAVHPRELAERIEMATA